MKYTCSACGARLDIDETTKVCKYCGAEISAEKDASGALANALKTKADKGAFLTSLVDAYSKSGDPQDLYTVISSYDEYAKLFDLDKVWRAFIISAAGAAVRNKDSALQLFLKNHAKQYDLETVSKKEGTTILRSILLSYPKFGTNNDWDDLIHATAGNRDEFSVISDSIIQYIAKEKDKAFAIDIFNLINAKGDEWAEIGKYYIRAFLSNDEIAANVFTVAAFDRAARSFATRLEAYCKKYLDGENEIAVAETKVFGNYTAACRAHKKRTIIASSIATAAILGIVLALILTLNSIKKDSISFTVDKVIEASYGDALDLSSYTLSYTKRSGKQVTEVLDASLLFGYDPELVGNQQNAYFEFRGVKTPVIIIVKATRLAAPTPTQSGNRIIWDTVPNAKSYAVYVNAIAIETSQTADRSFDLSTLSASGELTVTVRALTDDTKFDSSPMSAPLTLTKLEAPKNLAYANGKLTWDSVAGATGYELSVNGTPYTAATAECTLPLVFGDNEITVTAVSTDPTIIHGVTKETFHYNKLSPIDGMTYQNGTIAWTATADATSFEVYVDGVFWKELARNTFSLVADGFTTEYNDKNAYKIEIVCKSSQAGIEASEKKGYTVAVGSTASLLGDTLSWTFDGTGVTYLVTVNGAQHTLSSPSLLLSTYTLAVGDNQIAVTARLGGTDYICESVTVKKLAAPTVSVTESGIQAEGGLVFRLDGGEWSNAAPSLEAFAAGTHTLAVKRPATGAFELDSDVTEVTVTRLTAPTIRVIGGELVCQYDNTVAALALSYRAATAESWIAISSLSDITYAGSYVLRANLTAKATSGTAFYLASGYSDELSVVKPAAPDVSYDAATGLISSTTLGARFYYTDEQGAEHEIAGGRASNLPGGVFSVYARLNATTDNTLHSENTPEPMRASVFNLDITFTLTQASPNQCYFVFEGCNDVDSLTLTYKIEYFNGTGAAIGTLDKTVTPLTLPKNANSPSRIAALINFRNTEIVFESGYTYTDIKKIKVTVYIGEDDARLTKTAELSIQS